MSCDRCGQEPGYAGRGGHTYICTLDDRIVCFGCGHNFGPVRELIEKAGLWNLYGSSAGAAELIATLTRERDEARGWAEQRLNHIHLCQMAKTTLTCERDEAVKERDEAQSCLRICQANYAKRKDECENVLRQCQKARQERDEARARIAELERELLNASELIEANEKLMNEEAKLRSEVERLYAANGLLLKGRDADRARIAELESAKRNVEAIAFYKNGTWEWRKV